MGGIRKARRPKHVKVSQQVVLEKIDLQSAVIDFRIVTEAHRTLRFVLPHGRSWPEKAVGQLSFGMIRRQGKLLSTPFEFTVHEDLTILFALAPQAARDAFYKTGKLELPEVLGEAAAQQVQWNSDIPLSWLAVLENIEHESSLATFYCGGGLRRSLAIPTWASWREQMMGRLTHHRVEPEVAEDGDSHLFVPDEILTKCLAMTTAAERMEYVDAAHALAAKYTRPASPSMLH